MTGRWVGSNRSSGLPEASLGLQPEMTAYDETLHRQNTIEVASAGFNRTTPLKAEPAGQSSRPSSSTVRSVFLTSKATSGLHGKQIAGLPKSRILPTILSPEPECGISRMPVEKQFATCTRNPSEPLPIELCRGLTASEQTTGKTPFTFSVRPV